MIKKRVMRRRRTGDLVIIKFLTRTARQLGWTSDPAKATEVTRDHIENMGLDVGPRGRFEVIEVRVDECSAVKQ